uniref:DnaJ (Hsp40) homolog, subfamily C, member 12 n=1 Tax=Oryzias latipes TaxID=8090 RepID=A0A3P9IHR2_ORYLA
MTKEGPRTQPTSHVGEKVRACSVLLNSADLSAESESNQNQEPQRHPRKRELVHRPSWIRTAEIRSGTRRSMDSLLRSKPEDREDFYGVLGCDELSSTEQILNEYRIRALASHPDKHLDDPHAVADFQKLQEAKEVLCDEDKRKSYDLWRRSGVTIPFRDWQALSDSVRTSLHWAVRTKKEPMLEAAGEPKTSGAEERETHEAGSSSSDHCHQRFRWAADSPSRLLQKFRNYEI